MNRRIPKSAKAGDLGLEQLVSAKRLDFAARLIAHGYVEYQGGASRKAGHPIYRISDPVWGEHVVKVLKVSGHASMHIPPPTESLCTCGESSPILQDNPLSGQCLHVLAALISLGYRSRRNLRLPEIG